MCFVIDDLGGGVRVKLEIRRGRTYSKADKAAPAENGNA
jgi:hypothetical protein